MTGIPKTVSNNVGSKKSVADGFILCAVSLLLIIVVRTAAQMASVSVGPSVVGVFLVFLPALIYVLLKRLALFESLGWKPVSPPIALRCLILGILGWGVVVVIHLATLRPLEAVLGPAPPGGFLTEAVASTIPGLVIFLIMVAVFPGLCEETLFRGTILPILERKGVWRGIVYTALLFAVFHTNPWIFFPAFGLGILLGLVTVRTNSTLPAMICHASTNATTAIVSFLYRRNSEHQPYLLVGVFAVLFVVVLIEFLYRTRGIKRQPSPLTAAPDKFVPRLKWIIIATLVTALILASAIAAKDDQVMTIRHQRLFYRPDFSSVCSPPLIIRYEVGVCFRSSHLPSLLGQVVPVLQDGSAREAESALRTGVTFLATIGQSSQLRKYYIWITGITRYRRAR